MLFMDMPEVPPQYTPVIVAQASQAKQANNERTIGICHPIENQDESRLSAVNSVSPLGAAYSYLKNVEHRKIEDAAYFAAKMTLLQAPKHGELLLDNDSGAYFSSDYSYEGPDSATVLVEVGGYKVKVIYHFVLMSDVPGSNEAGSATDNKAICPNGRAWKISSTHDANGNNAITAIEYLPPDFSATGATLTGDSLSSWLNLAQLDGKIADLSGVNVTVADLPGAAVGQTTGTTITLDTTAAGNGWYIDTTPADNSEYLPTSNPYEWVAKEGSDAYGKMDMLSVLLHEYGHVLGIEHSADNHDYMATTLTPGVRRMPSADELALMQQLVGQVKGEMVASTTDSTPTPTLPLQGGGGLPLPIPLGAGFGIAFMGRLRGSRYGDLSIAPDYATLTTKYAVAANATFANLATPAGWNTQGSATFNPDPSTDSGTSTGSVRTASVTLNEISTSQTRLSQVFMLNEQDRYLSFTLSGAALDDLNGAPDDAFEVALLDANTGLSVLGGNGLTRTDSFLNLQADGTQHASDCVTCTWNSDGSRTYRVDLSGVARNTAVNLSFDLLGFGQDNSHVTLSDIRESKHTE